MSLSPSDPEVIEWLNGVALSLSNLCSQIANLAEDPNNSIGEVRGAAHKVSDELFKGFAIQGRNWRGELPDRPTLPHKPPPSSLESLA